MLPLIYIVIFIYTDSPYRLAKLQLFFESDAMILFNHSKKPANTTITGFLIIMRVLLFALI